MILGIILLYVLALSQKVTLCLKDVILQIQPKVVEYGGDSTLRCLYDLEGAPLYSVKWYRGMYEFYRFVPKEYPRTKIFPLDGIKVDLDRSNSEQVVLQNLTFIVSGRFSCEVTTEGAPLIFTTTAVEDMMVVVLPDKGPHLVSNKGAHIPGENLIANCSSSPSRPASDLTFILNNIVVCTTCRTRKISTGKLLSSFSTLKISLVASHFQSGRLKLKCIATIGDLYQQENEITFYYDQNPVSERVTSSSASKFTWKLFSAPTTLVTFSSYILTFLCTLS